MNGRSRLGGFWGKPVDACVAGVPAPTCVGVMMRPERWGLRVMEIVLTLEGAGLI